MGQRVDKVKTHFRDNWKPYFAGVGGLAVGALAVLAVTQKFNSNEGSQIVQSISGISYKPENRAEITNVVIELPERSTPSTPVHLKGTNLYFASLSEASRETGHSLSEISKNVNGHKEHIGGDVFELIEPSEIA